MTSEEELQKEHFTHICSQTNFFNDKLTDAFTSYVQTLSAIIGGSIWLAIQKENKLLSHTAEVWLSDGIVVLLTLVTIARVSGNLHAWFSARRMQHKILSSVPPPHWFRSIWLEVALIVSVGAACLIFCLANPFNVAHSN